MTGASTGSLQHSQFNTFLFAPIGDDRNGLPLSVLSALARLDIDPWDEAESLNRMPVATATLRLTSMIGALPNMAVSHLDAASISSRLIALLPRRNGERVLVTSKFARLDQRVPSGVLGAALLIAFVLGALAVLMTR